MKYRFEYHVNPEYVTIHVTVKLTEEFFVSHGVESKDPTVNGLLNIMRGVEGAKEISIRPYEIIIHRGAAFDRDEVLQSGMALLTMWMKAEHLMEDGEEITFLGTIRSDIRQHLCPECELQQQREMKQCARDFDSLDW